MLDINRDREKRIIDKLKFLYGDQADAVLKEVRKIIIDFNENFPQQNPIEKYEKKFGHWDIILNTYADSIKGKQGTPFQALYRFSNSFIRSNINGVHVLPFYPWDTDRGFSVLNYWEVDPRNGSWQDITALSEIFDNIMVDCVVNHGSIDNPIIQKALIGDPEFNEFVISYTDQSKPSREELVKITRARPSPVLTRFFILVDKNKKKWATFNKPLKDKDSIVESGWVWTTFSRPDNPYGTVATRQVDFNYANPKVFLEFLRIMLFYISKGVSWLRLDAIGYLWKEIGTPCLHLPEAHAIIQLISEIFRSLDLNIVLIAEVNEPQEKALLYLGTKEQEEADMIYLFSHFPLAVHAILTGSAKYYMNWLPSLVNAEGKLFVSVLGTHDGMGMKPIGNWLPEAEKRKLQDILVKKHGALPNYAILPGGQKIIYELCSTPWNFVNEPNSNEPLTVQIDRYLAVLALGLMLKGVPSIYINGLLGVPNYEGYLDENRTINRQIFEEDFLYVELKNKKSQMYKVFSRVMDLISLRRTEKAFDLTGHLQVYPINEAVVSGLLSSSNGTDKIISLINVSKENQKIKLDLDELDLDLTVKFEDIITNVEYEQTQPTRMFEMTMKPYQICWLKIVH